MISKLSLASFLSKHTKYMQLAATSRIIFGMCLLLSSTLTLAATTKKITLGQNLFLAIEAPPQKTTLHWKDSNQKPYHYFSDLKKALTNQGNPPEVLMNAGIYGLDYTPAGLHIEAGKVLKQLNTKKGSGNFHLQPNGVFLITKKNKAKILTTKAYKKYYGKKQNRIRLATQSGPMLLINGKINRRFIKKGQSVYTRNAVCTTAAHTVYFVISNEPVNFYTFAKATKKLGCKNALYLDGSISKLYQREHNSTKHFRHFVGILAVKP